MNSRKPSMTPKKTPMTIQAAKIRTCNFNEVALGYTIEEALAEAERCLNCPQKYCTENCPANIQIPEFIAEIREGNFGKAYEIITHTNIIPEISGRVCPYERQCESRCTRGIKHEPVAIGKLERFVADWSVTHLQSQAGSSTERIRLTADSKRIAVVGAGPAGLTCAYSLAMAGFHVTVFEKSSEPGGIPLWGIPSFVLPKELMKNKIEMYLCPGIDLRLNKALGKDFTLESLRSKYDAVFVSIGAGKPVSLDLDVLEITGNIETAPSDAPEDNFNFSDLNGVIQAVDYLSAKNTPYGKYITVIGGGKAAISAARTAARCGAKKVTLLFNNIENQMSATKESIILAREEGVEFLTLTEPSRFIAAVDSIVSDEGHTATDSFVSEVTSIPYRRLFAIECNKMIQSKSDYPGGPTNVNASGEKIVIETDLAILALGCKNELVSGLKTDAENRIIIDENYQTSMEGVYAGGEAVTGSTSIMKAAAAGKNAAAAIFARWM